MKRLLATLVFAVQAVAPAFADPMPAKDVALIDQAIERSNAAFLRSDAEALADATSERVLQAVGREQYLASVKAGMKGMQEQGIRLVSHTMAPPTPPIPAGDFIATLYPGFPADYKFPPFKTTPL